MCNCAECNALDNMDAFEALWNLDEPGIRAWADERGSDPEALDDEEIAACLDGWGYDSLTANTRRQAAWEEAAREDRDDARRKYAG